MAEAYHALRAVSEEWQFWYDAADELRRTRGEHASIAAAARRMHAFADTGERECAIECHTDAGKLVYRPMSPGKLRDFVTADAMALAASLIQRGIRVRFDYGNRVTTLSEYDPLTAERCVVVFTGTPRPRLDPPDGICVACHLHFRRVRSDSPSQPIEQIESVLPTQPETAESKSAKRRRKGSARQRKRAHTVIAALDADDYPRATATPEELVTEATKKFKEMRDAGKFPRNSQPPSSSSFLRAAGLKD